MHLLEAPEGAENGARVRFGDLPEADAATPTYMQKKKVLEKCAAFLRTDADGVATVLGKAFTLDAGAVTAPLKDSPIS